MRNSLKVHPVLFCQDCDNNAGGSLCPGCAMTLFYKTGQIHRHNQQGRAHQGKLYEDVYLSKDKIE